MDGARDDVDGARGDVLESTAASRISALLTASGSSIVLLLSDVSGMSSSVVVCDVSGATEVVSLSVVCRSCSFRCLSPFDEFVL